MLGSAINTPAERAAAAAADVRAFVERCVVVLPVGGEGSRLRSLASAENVQKNALRLPGGDTMLERVVRMYRAAGFARFLALVYHHAESIKEVLGDGADLGVEVRYSHDPAIPVGRGGAIRNAYEHGFLAAADHLIVHNPDDVIIDYPGSFPLDIVQAHLAGARAGAVATAVVVDGARVPYTGLRVDRGVIAEVVAYPFVPIPAHIGVTAFGSEAASYFLTVFDLSRKMDFESELFPILVERRQLHAFQIEHRHWLQVNDPKSFTALMQRLQAEADAAQ
jgi:NDP-sugar pyrophosphorylase family protein